jgi:hypothetical protein
MLKQEYAKYFYLMVVLKIKKARYSASLQLLKITSITFHSP